MFKAKIEIDNIDDYKEVTGHATSKKPTLICPFCGNTENLVVNVIPNIQYFDSKYGGSKPSQQADVFCPNCSLSHPRHLSEVSK